MTEPARRLVLLRHGRTAWNAAHRLQGQSDVEIDDTGHRQAAAVAPVVAAMRPAALWSSDSARARETAAYVAKETGLDPTYDPRLREYFLADRQGLTHDEYAALAPDEFAAFRGGDYSAIPGAETTEQVAGRMVAALRDLLASVAPGETAVAVSHGAAIRDAVPMLLGWPVAAGSALHGIANCAWAEFDEAEPGGRLRLLAYNRTA